MKILGTVTIAARSRRGTTREIFPSLALERNAMMDLPPLESKAPLTKSSCPPVPLNSEYSMLVDVILG